MKNISIGLTVFGMALGVGLFSVSYATNLSVNEVAERPIHKVEVAGDTTGLREFANGQDAGIIVPSGTTAQRETNPVEGTIRYNSDDDAMHAEKEAIFEDNQVTQEEIDSLTNTKLKDRLTEKYASELEDGIITEDELKSGHKNHKGKGHKKGRGMHNHDDDYVHDDED